MHGETEEGEQTIRRRKKTPPTGENLLRLVETLLDDDKAQDVIVIDLAGKTAITDFMVIASGNSRRQVGAMVDHIRERLKGAGLPAVPVEGEAHCDWVLVDAGDVVVHIFRPEIRAFYNLEKLWSVPPSATRRGRTEGMSA